MSITSWRSWDHEEQADVYQALRIEKPKETRTHLLPARAKTIEESRAAMRNAGLGSMASIGKLDLEKTHGNTSKPTEKEFLEWVAEKEGVIHESWPSGRVKEGCITFGTALKPKDRVKADGILSSFVKMVLVDFHPWVNTSKLNNHSCVVTVGTDLEILVMESNFDKLNGTSSVGRGYTVVRKTAKEIEIKGVEVLVYKQEKETK